MAAALCARAAPLSAAAQPTLPDLRASGAKPDWQTLACALALRGLTLITGGPGTGKTTTVVRVLALLQHQAIAARRRCACAWPRHRQGRRPAERSLESARQRLVGLAPDEVLPAHPADRQHRAPPAGQPPDSWHFRHHWEALHADVVVVDEASMIDLEMMAALLDARRNTPG